MPGIAHNLTRERLKQGKVAFGLQVRFVRSIDIARGAASCGYHYLFIDLEHSTLLRRDTTSRRGAQGIMFPHAETADYVREAVANCKFPPLGHRSHAGPSPLLAWQSLPVAESSRILNENMIIGVNVESAKGIDNIDEIMAVAGLDMVAVGTNDLALDMGIPGEFEHPRILSAYDRVMVAARRHGVFVRFGGVYDLKLMQRNIEMGARLVTLTGDLKIMLQGMRQTLDKFAGAIDPVCCEPESSVSLAPGRPE